jgi:hypothetical protein
VVNFGAVIDGASPAQALTRYNQPDGIRTCLR